MTMVCKTRVEKQGLALERTAGKAAIGPDGRTHSSASFARSGFRPAAVVMSFVPRISLAGLLTVVSLAVVSVGATNASGEEAVQFNRDIRRILSDKCFSCHGPDPETREADLRLDVRANAIGELGGHTAIVPGDVAASELLQRVTSTDADVVMPPPEFNKPVTAEEVATLRRWIEAGANYEQHWAFTPIQRPELPAGDSANAIDAFIDARINAAGLESNDRADARTLARRLAFDLTGLPAEADVVEGFVAAPSKEAYGRLAEAYLGSPQYGERMAMYWLDLVRYADTLGFHGDQDRSVSPYRDYVIDAFNANKPFDQFTIEQLGGDLLPDATLSQKVASTYNRLNRASAEGGVQPKEYLAKYSADRVRTLGSVWLGTTVGCAECHDHKFDPFSTKDFYSFAAFFADIREQGIVGGARHTAILPVPTPEQAAEQGRLKAQLEIARTQYAAETVEIAEARDQWASQIVEAASQWSVLKVVHVQSSGGAELTAGDDGAVLASGPNPDQDTYTVSFPTESIKWLADASQIALRLELLTDESLPQKGPGRAGNGNLVLNRISMSIGDRVAKWDVAKAAHSQSGFPASNLASNSEQGWAILPKAGQPHELVLIGKLVEAKNGKNSAEPSATERPEAVVEIVQKHGAGHNLGKFRLSVATAVNVDLSSVLDPVLAAAAGIPKDARSAEQSKQLDDAFRVATPLLAEVRAEIARVEAGQKQLENEIVTTLGTSATTPRDIRVLPRGNWMDDSGDVVQPAVPAFLSGTLGSDDARATRLDLAQWLVAKENPLVARAFVNRLWLLFFGQGLARNVDDLGSQGDVPTHPKLLDWLAAEFVESGWDVKHLVRLIVTSDAYQRDSRVTPEMRQKDPLNRLFARQGRYRLEAEMVRDLALSVSGLLDPTIGGKSVRPYQPAGYWDQLNFPRRTYQHDSGNAQYRRGLYTHWQRTFLHPSLMAFDAPAREECTAQRPRSNTPLQSLVLLNDPTYVEAARVLAQRILLEATGDSAERMHWLFRETLAREPSERELALLEQLLSENKQVFDANPTAADELMKVGLAPVPAECDKVELAAWTAVTRAVLNLHEVITRY